MKEKSFNYTSVHFIYIKDRSLPYGIGPVRPKRLFRVTQRLLGISLDPYFLAMIYKIVVAELFEI